MKFQNRESFGLYLALSCIRDILTRKSNINNLIALIYKNFLA